MYAHKHFNVSLLKNNNWKDYGISIKIYERIFEKSDHYANI